MYSLGCGPSVGIPVYACTVWGVVLLLAYLFMYVQFGVLSFCWHTCLFMCSLGCGPSVGIPVYVCVV